MKRQDTPEINPDCPCTYPGCPRHGDCKACREYHHSRGQKTSCERLRQEERGDS